MRPLLRRASLLSRPDAHPPRPVDLLFCGRGRHPLHRPRRARYRPQLCDRARDGGAHRVGVRGALCLQPAAAWPLGRRHRQGPHHQGLPRRARRRDDVRGDRAEPRDALIARICAGLAAGGTVPVSIALVGDRVAVAERQVALSRLLMAMLSGQLAGAAGAGAIGQAFGGSL